MSRYPVPERHQIIEDFVQYLGKSTKVCYRAILNGYFRFLKIDSPNEYFKIERDYSKDLQEFAFSIRIRPPKTQQSSFSILKNFFEHYDIAIKTRIWKQIRQRNHINGSRAIIEEFVPTNDDLKKILNHSKSAKDKALFSLLATAGMRIDEALSLTFDDIDMEKRHIVIQGVKDGEFNTKTGSKRHTFFTQEAKEVLESWLVEREKFLENGYRKSSFVRKKLSDLGISFKKMPASDHDRPNVWIPYKDGKEISREELFKNENRIFPFLYTNALEMWTTILERAGPPYNEKDNNPRLNSPIIKCRIHTLRKFFYTQLESTGANIQHINFMGGHDSELNRTYTSFTVDKLKETYDKHCYYLSIFTDLEKTERKIKPQLEAQSTTITSLIEKNQKMEHSNQHLLDLTSLLQKRIDGMEFNRDEQMNKSEKSEISLETYNKKLKEAYPEEVTRFNAIIKEFNKSIGF